MPLIHFNRSRNQRITQHFWTKEFLCGCQRKLWNKLHDCYMELTHIELLEEFRDLLSKKFGQEIFIEVTSGHRCQWYNDQVPGSAKSSQHRNGLATDIKSYYKYRLRKIYINPHVVAQIAERLGFGGIGIYPTFVHVDSRQGHARW